MQSVAVIYRVIVVCITDIPVFCVPLSVCCTCTRSVFLTDCTCLCRYGVASQIQVVPVA
jgi:hypothetical protein